MNQDLKQRVYEFNSKPTEWWISIYRAVRKNATSTIETAQGILKDMVSYSRGLEQKLQKSYDNGAKLKDKLANSNNEILNKTETINTQLQEIQSLDQEILTQAGVINQYQDENYAFQIQIKAYVKKQNWLEQQVERENNKYKQTQEQLTTLQTRIDEGVLLEGDKAEEYRALEKLKTKMGESYETFLGIIDRGFESLGKIKEDSFKNFINDFKKKFGQKE